MAISQRRPGHGRRAGRVSLGRRIAVAVVAAAALGVADLPVAGGAAAATDPCADSPGGSAPVLHGVVITQGVGSVQPLVRGKTTIIRLLLSAPTCAPAGSQQLLSASLTVSDGSSPVTVPTTPSVLGPAYPVLDSHANAPTPASPANPLFRVPALAGGNTTNGLITVTFRATVTYQYVAGGAAPETRTATYTQSPADPTKPISATVAPKTNALRVLVVPMADTGGVAGPPPAAQFPTASAGSPLPAGVTQAADAVVQTGMQALSRLLPVRDGIGDLSPATSPGPVGLRYRLLNTSSIDLGPSGLNVMSSGKFCGTGGNFEKVSTQLSNFLNAWNKQNSGAQADRVLGVVWQEVSTGGGACAEGMANMSGTQAWTRLLSDNAPDGGSATAASPYVGRGTSMTGPIVAMELAHTVGSLPRLDPRSQTVVGGSSFYSPHSPNVSADGASALQTYNITLATWLSGALSVMRYSGTSGGTNASNAPSAWNNNTGLFERDDYRYMHCALTPGMAAALCPYNSAVGTAGGAAAGSAVMLGGITDGTIAGTVLHSYTADGVELTPSDPGAAVRLIQRDSNGAVITGPLGNQGVPLTRADTHHGSDHDHEISERTHGSISAAMALAPGATAFELWLGQPPAGSGPCSPGLVPAGGCFYARAAGTAPTITSSTGSSSLANVQDFTPTAGDDVASAVSPDGGAVAWTTAGGIRIQRRDASTGLASGAATAPIPGGIAPTWSNDGRLAYATEAGDVFDVTVNTATDPPALGSPRTVYNHTVQRSLTLESTVASNPTFDPTGQWLAVGINGGIWRIGTPQTLPANGVTCDLISFAPTGSCDSLTRVGANPSWGWIGGTGNGGLVAFETAGGISTLDPNSLAPSPLGYATTARVASATAPAWGATLLAFVRAGDIWVADSTLAASSAWDNQTQVTTSGSDWSPSMSATGNVVSFDRTTTSTGRDVFTGIRQDHYRTVSYTATTQGDPRLLETDVYQSCGHGLEPVTVFRRSTSTSAGPPASATFTFEYDDSRGCPGGSLQAQVTNGFLSSPLRTIRTFPVATTPPPTLTPAIAAPTQGATYFQYDHVIAAASAIDSASGTNPTGLGGTWTLTGPEGSGINNTEVGTDATSLVLNPPVNGWVPGEYSLTLRITGGATTSTTYIVLPDPGHKGRNVGVAFNPHTLYVPSNGNYVTVTITPQAQRLSEIDPKTVAITEVGNQLLTTPIRLDPTAGKTAWVRNGDGSYTAKFNRQALSCALSQMGMVGFWVPVVVSGSSADGVVSFTGFDPKNPMTSPATSPVTCS